MRVFMVCQPWTRFRPPVDRADSIAIWSDQVGRRLGPQWTATLLCRSDPGQPPHEHYRGVSYHRLPYWPKWRGYTRAARTLTALGFRSPRMDTPQFAALYGVWASASAAAGKADVIHIHNFSQFLPVFRRAHPRARLVLHMHCDWLGCLDPEALRPNLEHADAIWTCSNHILLRARDRFPEFKTRFSYVPNGVEVDRFKLARRRLPQGPVDAPILFVGRLSPEKGLHVLIEAFARVTARRPDARLWLVGPDAATPREFLVDIDSDPQVRDLKRFDPNDYSRVLKEMIPEALRTRVRFLGQHPPATLPALYAKAGVLVNPSLSESFGMSLIEAMAAGVPVVATHTGGMPEIIESGCTGLLVPPGDPKALAEAIEQALSDIPLRVRLIRNAAQLATARFSWDRIADDVRIRYTKLLQTPAVTT